MNVKNAISKIFGIPTSSNVLNEQDTMIIKLCFYIMIVTKAIAETTTEGFNKRQILGIIIMATVYLCFVQKKSCLTLKILMFLHTTLTPQITLFLSPFDRRAFMQPLIQIMVQPVYCLVATRSSVLACISLCNHGIVLYFKSRHTIMNRLTKSSYPSLQQMINDFILLGVEGALSIILIFVVHINFNRKALAS
jgi:hypothetical protein